MKKAIALLLTVLLIVCISIPAFATNDSNQGGPPEKPPVSPPTGAIIVASLAVVAVGAGVVFAITNKKSK